MKTETIWQDFLSIVRVEVGSRVVETWFKAIILRQWDAYQKIIYLEAPNHFVKDWVASHYLSLFTQHLSRLLGEHSLRIIFLDPVVAPQKPIDTKQDVSSVANQSLKVNQSNQQTAQNTMMNIKPAVKAPLARLPAVQRPGLNSNYIFESFVVGSHNSLAYAAAHAISEKPGKLYNPFFIYGGSGLGKTHLLHAIGNAISLSNKRARVLYQSADRFVNEFINAIRFDRIYQFETKYKDVDVLLVDDIQFISNKEQTQEAFFHIFNTLYQTQKQIVFTSDSLPRDIAGLAERMRSRLESGLVTDISMPTLETKIAILKKKADIHGEHLPDDIAEYIASTVVSNIRELEGALIRVLAFVSLTKEPLSLELVQRVIARRNDAAPEGVDLKKIATHVAGHFAYSMQDIRSPKRNKDLTCARHVAIYLMKKLTKHSLREIGTFLDRKDHSTVLHALEKIELRKNSDPVFSQLLTQLERQVSVS